MSMYNILNGVNPATFVVFPLLGLGHAEDCKIPRFRDCFISKDNKHIEVYTRMGGGNRECTCKDDICKDEGKDRCWACISEEIEESESCISRIDNDFDCTYCLFTFKVPDRWKKDFDLIVAGNIKETSKEYKALIIGLLKQEETKKHFKIVLGC